MSRTIIIGQLKHIFHFLSLSGTPTTSAVRSTNQRILINSTRNLVASPKSGSPLVSVTTNAPVASFFNNNQNINHNQIIFSSNSTQTNEKPDGYCKAFNNNNHVIDIRESLDHQAKAASNAATEGPGNRDGQSERDAGNNQKASLQQLTLVEQQLREILPKFFNTTHNLSLYTEDIKFIDNIRGIKTQGKFAYNTQIHLIKAYYSFKYAYLKVELLNLVKVPEESSIRIRWRIVTKPSHLKFVLLFYKFRTSPEWKDGISTMHVNNEGKIFCHICDNIDVDLDIKCKDKESIKSRLVNRGLNVQIK